MKVDSILRKAEHGERISFEEGVYIYENASLAQLGVTANRIRNQKADPDVVTDFKRSSRSARPCRT